MKSIEKQKTTIKSKFKTLQRFIMITGLDPKKAQSYFAGRMAQDDVDDFQLTIKTLIKETKSNDDLSIIDDTTRMSIWRMIKWHYRTLKSFSIEYPEFPYNFDDDDDNDPERIKYEEYCEYENESFNIVTKFYGVSNDTYIPYLLFYVFLALCIIIVSK